MNSVSTSLEGSKAGEGTGERGLTWIPLMGAELQSRAIR